jgi:flagellin
MQETHTLLLRMRELAVQSANGTLTDPDRAHTNAEFKQLQAEIDRISANTTFASQKLLDGSVASFKFQIGEGSGQTIDVTIGDIDTSYPVTSGSTNYYGVAGTSTSSSTAKDAAAGGFAVSTDASTAAVVTITAHTFVTGDIVHADLDAGETGATGLTDGNLYTVTKLSDDTFSLTNYDANGAGAAVINHGGSANSATITFTKLDKTGVDSASNAQIAIKAVDYAIDFVSTERGKLGAVSNRLTSTINNIEQISINLSASKGRIEDADFAAETGNLAKNQILQQAATAMLAQANASKQQVLTLIR